MTGVFETVWEEDSAVPASPTASAGSDQRAAALAVTTLDGSGSGAGTYAWTSVSVPSGSAITVSDLSDATAQSPTYTPDVAGRYVWQISVTASGVSAQDQTTAIVDGYSPVDWSGATTTDPNGVLDGAATLGTDGGVAGTIDTAGAQNWGSGSENAARIHTQLLDDEGNALTYGDLDGVRIIIKQNAPTPGTSGVLLFAGLAADWATLGTWAAAGIANDNAVGPRLRSGEDGAMPQTGLLTAMERVYSEIRWTDDSGTLKHVTRSDVGKDSAGAMLGAAQNAVSNTVVAGDTIRIALIVGTDKAVSSTAFDADVYVQLIYKGVQL